MTNLQQASEDLKNLTNGLTQLAAVMKIDADVSGIMTRVVDCMRDLGDENTRLERDLMISETNLSTYRMIVDKNGGSDTISKFSKIIAEKQAVIDAIIEALGDELPEGDY